MLPAGHHLTVWFTPEQAAEACGRSVGTIKNLMSKHQLPRRLLWRITNRRRRRCVFLSEAVVLTLRRLTLERED